MKINLEGKIKNFDGDIVKERVIGDKEGEVKLEELTLKRVCVNSLMFEDSRSQEKISGDQKMKNFLLAKKLHEAKQLELKSEEKVLIKKQVAKNYGTLIYGVVSEMLEK